VRSRASRAAAFSLVENDSDVLDVDVNNTSLYALCSSWSLQTRPFPKLGDRCTILLSNVQIGWLASNSNKWRLEITSSILESQTTTEYGSQSWPATILHCWCSSATLSESTHSLYVQIVPLAKRVGSFSLCVSLGGIVNAADGVSQSVHFGGGTFSCTMKVLLNQLML
jgi:hypothetical protein